MDHGSLAGANWSRVSVMLPVTLVCVVLFWTQYMEFESDAVGR